MTTMTEASKSKAGKRATNIKDGLPVSDDSKGGYGQTMNYKLEMRKKVARRAVKKKAKR